MLGVGDKFPEFKVKATVSTDMKNAFKDLSDDSYPGKWKIYFFGRRISPSSARRSLGSAS